MSEIEKEILRRRTFAIISHPDAGKTTITEKLLLYGGAINMAGSVKAKRSKKFATSDWMELEKQRGISVTSSVMKFPYKNFELNLIDTPGHEDFSEDTYRTLTAVDSVLMVLDVASGVEAQTKKLFEVCRLRNSPILGFINKLDREGKDPFELMEEIEQVLGIKAIPVTWPIGSGSQFRGVYHRQTKNIHLFDKSQDRSRRLTSEGSRLSQVGELVDQEARDKLIEDIELLDGAGDAFDKEEFLRGQQVPVFFGSALFSFGVESLLEALIGLAPKPLPRQADTRLVHPEEKKFSGFIFKIQANMDPAHRDRVAFMRICSGKFSRGMKAHIVRLGKDQRLSRPTQFMSQDRSLVDEAVAGDIVGVHDPGVFKIGDTLTEGEKLYYQGIPIFAPEHFVRVFLEDPLRSKQLTKALNQLSEEGAVQVFRPINSNDQVLGVVGVLQFDVVKFRVKHEYGVDVKLTPLSYSAARWIHCSDEMALKDFVTKQSSVICHDQHENYTVLLDDLWRLNFYRDKFPKIEFSATSEKI